MKIGIKVGDIMNRNFIFINPEKSLKEAAEKMLRKKVGSLVLKKAGKFKGIVTEKDIVLSMVNNQIEKIGEIGSKITISPSEDIYNALEKMAEKKTRQLPVVSSDKVLGLLTLKDILEVEPSLLEIVSSKIK
jgi:CBS domain-containing protein